MRQTFQPESHHDKTHEPAQVPVPNLPPELQSKARTEAPYHERSRAPPVSLQHLRVQEQQQVHPEGSLHTEAHQRLPAFLHGLQEAVQNQERSEAAHESGAQRRAAHHLQHLRTRLQERARHQGAHEVPTLQASL